MSYKDDIKKLIDQHTRRLQKLKEQQAIKGVNTAPEILIEIEDIEAKISDLKSIEDLVAKINHLQTELRAKDPVTAAKLEQQSVSFWRKPWFLILMVVIGGSIVIIIMGLGMYFMNPTMPPPEVSWVSMSYIVNNFDPRRVDLREISDSGILVPPGSGLRLFDINLFVSGETFSYKVAAEIYLADTDTLIGSTEPTPLHEGLVLLNKILIQPGFGYEQDTDAWYVNQQWTDLTIAFIAYDANDQSTVLMRRNIHLDPEGLAWFYEPPNINFVSLVYSINDGPEAILDLRSAEKISLKAQPGDELTLKDVWYRSNAAGDDDTYVHLEAHLGDEFDQETFGKTEEPERVRLGINHLRNIASLRSWIVPDPPEAQPLSLFLLRTPSKEFPEAKIADRMQISLSPQGSLGLTSVNEVIHWPLDQVEYIDFESPDELSEWTLSEQAAEFITLDRAVKPTFSGSYALAVTASAGADVPLAILNRDDRPFQANLIIGQVYWPDQIRGTPKWAQACLGNAPEECRPIPIKTDQWNTFVFDLTAQENTTGLLNSQKFSRLWIKSDLDHPDPNAPYSFYIDGIQIYPGK